MSKFMNRPPPSTTMPPQQTSQTFVDRIPVGLDHAPSAFDLRGQLIGAGGANLHYIRNETGAVATLRGRGSLFIDPQLGTESQEPMHLYIEHTRYEGLQSAKQLARNLIETLQSELVHFQQVNPPVHTVQYAPQPVMQPTQNITTQQQVVPSQMSVPPPMLAVPPPIVQSNANGLEHINNQQVIPQNFITHPAPSIAPTTAQQSQQPTIIQQQTMIPQTLPIHLQGNMVIQQQVQPAPTIGNVSIPPPGIHHIPVKQGSLVHLQGPPPSVHLSQPPPTTQIVLNQPPHNYQYQYIQQPLQTNEVAGQPNQVTIQHIYQPQHQLQGMHVQQTVQPNPQFNHFTQQTIRPQQQQQYIVHNVQGNTAYMVPPPNIIHQQPQHQNIIFQTQPPQIQQIPLQQIQQMQQQPPTTDITSTNMTVGQNHNTSNTSTSSDEANKDTSNVKSEPGDESPCDKTDDKPDSENQVSDTTSNSVQPQTSVAQTQQIQLRPTQTQPTVTQVPPPIMAVPPPMTCVQHIVGNTLITTTQPTQPQTHQIYNQIPVSIQQITAPTQQIHVSTPNGQHFLVNAQQWQPQHQFQQVTQNGNIQSFQLTQPIRHPNEIVVSNQALITQPNTSGDFRPQQQHILATTFNPHIQAPVTGMQVQFQPVQQQQLMQQHVIEQQQQQQQQVQQLINSVPPPTNCFTTSQPPQIVESKVNLPYPQRNSPQPVPYPQSKTNIIDSHLRAAQKRKFDDDDTGQQQMPPRMGMGSNSGGNFLNNQRDGSHSNNNNGNGGQAATTTTSTSNVQDETNGDTNFINSSHGGNNKSSPHLQHDQQSQSSSSSSFLSDNRPFYQRDNGDIGMGYPDAASHRNPFGDMPPSGRGQRFRPNNNRDFPYPMRPPHMQESNNFPMHRMNYFGPPPPPPPYPHRNDHFRGQW